MPLRTELATVKELLRTVVVKLRFEATVPRESNALSEGELVRVGTLPDGGLVESLGNTR